MNPVPNAYKQILIGYDGSNEAERAFAEGLMLAALTHAEVTVLTVAEPLPGYYNMAALVAPEVPESLRRERLTHLSALQAKAAALAAEHEVRVSLVLVENGAIDGILAAARDLKADLLVLGLSRHRQMLDWAGTVHAVAKQSPCSILAVI